MDKKNAPYQISRIDRLVGVVIVVALILVAIGMVRHFRESTPISASVEYHTLLQRSFGITKGADIRLAGISIGKVADIVLQKSGKVRLDLQINRSYQEFITAGSYLEIASTMGLAAIVELTKLNLVSNPDNTNLIPPGSYIETAEPADLSEAFNAHELTKVGNNIKTILENISQLSESMALNQELISQSLTNVNEITLEVKDAVEALPDIVDSATSGFAAWENAGTGLYTVINDVSGDDKKVGENSVEASDKLESALDEMKQLVSQLNAIMKRMRESADQVPEVISDAHALIEGANRLTDQLNRHWLFSGKQTKDESFYTPSIHPVTGIPVDGSVSESSIRD